MTERCGKRREKNVARENGEKRTSQVGNGVEKDGQKGV